MKTTKVLFVAMLLSLTFMWSCQKEGSMTPDASGSQTFADSESANSGDGSGLSDTESAFIADLQDQLDSLEANFDSTTQVSYQNSNNPYDYSGERHNAIVHEVGNNLSEIYNPAVSKTFTYLKADSFEDIVAGQYESFTEQRSDVEGKTLAYAVQFASTNYATPNIGKISDLLTTVNYELGKLRSESGTITIESVNNSIDLMYDVGNISALENYLVKMVLNLNSIQNYNLYIAMIKVQEALVKNSNVLTSIEKRKFLTMTSVARYSRKYWEFDATNEAWQGLNSNKGIIVDVVDYIVTFAVIDWFDAATGGDPAGVDTGNWLGVNIGAATSAALSIFI